MRLVSVVISGQEILGFERDGKITLFETQWAKQMHLPLSLKEVFANEDSIHYVKELGSFLEDAVAGNHVQVIDSSNVHFAPSVPKGKKIVCVGLNYQKHAHESKMDLPQAPLLFSKFDNTLVGHQAVVKKPSYTEQMDYEAEVGVVIGRRASQVSTETAFDYVLGYTNTNDLSARDAQFLTSQWLLGKTGDGFCPVGPALVTADEVDNPSDLRVRCFVNGEERQNASTSLMIFSIPELVSYISHHFTLEPGDLILTGTPQGVVFGKPEEEQKWLQPGDEVVVDIEVLGQLKTIIGA